MGSFIEVKYNFRSEKEVNQKMVILKVSNSITVI